MIHVCFLVVATITAGTLAGGYACSWFAGRPSGWWHRRQHGVGRRLRSERQHRPNGYSPMHKQGGIVLGIGGDNSSTARGNFFEGVMTVGYASSATDDAVQANIVAAGYGK
jgi:hypothetical protein